MKKVYSQMLKLAEHFKASLLEEKAWWFLRWSYFGIDDHTSDATARVQFLNKYYDHTQGFTSYEDAVKLAYEHHNKMIVILDSSVPGNITMMHYTKDKLEIAMYNINQSWRQRTLADIAHSIFPAAKKITLSR
jgi:hypothetical protein